MVYDCREAEDDFGDNKLTREQAPPQPSDGDVWLLVLKDMEERRRHGIEKYGRPVQVGNGRDHLIDLYQELLDACVYTRQEIERCRNGFDEAIAHLKQWANQEGPLAAAAIQLAIAVLEKGKK